MKDYMKIWMTFFITMVFFALSLTNITAVENNSSDIMKLTYSFDNPIISKFEIDGNIYDKVSMPDCYTAGNTGEPDIPSKGAYILLPPELIVNNIQVKAKNKEILGVNYNINPISQPIPISNAKVSVKLQKDNDIYDNNALYPGNLYTFVGTYTFKGYEILVLLLHPMQYNSVTGELFYYKDLEITIETKYNGKSELFRGLKKDELEVKNKVDNPEISELYSKELGTKPASFDSYDLLILTVDSLKSSFEPLKNAHDANGLNTIIKTLTDIGSSDPLDIRDYIRDAYSNLGVDYVLIGGDIEVIPARILYVYGLDEETTPYETFMPSDLYYSCLNGPFNYDGDENWGEPTDGEDGGDVDLMAEVHVGRACVDDVSDVNNFVSKTVDYINKNPQRNYLNKACLAGEYLGEHGIATWGGNYLDQLIDVCNDDGYTTTGLPSDEFNIIKLYDRDWPENNWPKEKIIDEIDSSLHIINHLGHSFFEYNLKMHYEDVYGLSNGDYCFIYSQGCMAGGFDCEYCDCIAEHFTVKTDTGAFAGIWNARFGFFWSNSTDGDSQRFHREYLDAVFGEGITEIGRANSDSKEDNLAIIGRSCIRWCYYQTNLFGDPSLKFYEKENSEPDRPLITGPTNGKKGVKYNFEFVATDPDEDSLDYYVEWGDNTNTGWKGPYASGQKIILSHTWNEEKVFTIKAKVRDKEGAESDWSYHDITITKNKILHNSLFVWLFNPFTNIFPILQKILLLHLIE